jgi:hypothetical protein
MTDLLISMECDGLMCGACEWLWDFWVIKRELSCLLFKKKGEQIHLRHYKTMPRRCPTCLAAEKKAKEADHD